MKTPTICAIVCAAGKGARTGFEKNKLLVHFEGTTVLQKTLSAFCLPYIHEIIVTASPEDFSEISVICESIPNAKTVLGGADRTHSVYNALQAATADIVLVHDGARPFVTKKIIDDCIQNVKDHGSGICAIPATDTIAQAENGVIVNVPNRNTLWQIQTPQGFYKTELLSAYEKALSHKNAVYTDDSSVYAAFVKSPTLYAGDKRNFKMTYAEDFSSPVRCGFGIDTHAFGKVQDYIVLAGVKVPSASGLIAHSDGDVLVHAVMDALLSAAGLKDIGHYFPDTDETWKNASSMKMLDQVVALLQQRGYGVQNISVAIQAERPRLAKYIDEMKAALAHALSIDECAVGISAGTNEGLGYVGEGKGITVHAYVLLKNIRTL